jgi:Uroporphyrinogen-III decarboxylase
LFGTGSGGQQRQAETGQNGHGAGPHQLTGCPSNQGVMDSLLVRAARGERTERPPVWLMRQAGRHIPEYRELRAEYSFLEVVRSPEIAAEISLLPWEYYRPDGVVMFSDILTVLEPLGFDYHIESGVGPVVKTLSPDRTTSTGVTTT